MDQQHQEYVCGLFYGYYYSKDFQINGWSLLSICGSLLIIRKQGKYNNNIGLWGYISLSSKKTITSVKIQQSL